MRNLVRAGVPERVAMQMTGHKTRSVFERCNIVSDGDLFDAAKKLNAVYPTQAIVDVGRPEGLRYVRNRLASPEPRSSGDWHNLGTGKPNPPQRTASN